MSRPDRRKLCPFIESLILRYGCEEGGGKISSGLKAHVIGVGHMSLSQAQGSSEAPPGLLHLSDGLLQIPAVLTASAWDNLQDQEELECFSSLMNATVYIQDYRLLFHMAAEQTRCRFFLSVGKLATTAAGPVKPAPPYCTTLLSVRQKICTMWRSLLGQEDEESQRSQCGGFDLSELLGEWQHDCLRGVLQEVRERLTAVVGKSPASSRPSTSTSTASPTPFPNSFVATNWDMDRVRYKGEKSFTVPKCLLLVPESVALKQQERPQIKPDLPLVPSEDRQIESLQVCIQSETTQPSVDDVEWQIARPAEAVLSTDCDAVEDSPVHSQREDSELHEEIIAVINDSYVTPLSNPWDMFPTPCVDSSSSSQASPETTPTHQPLSQNGPAVVSAPPHSAILTSAHIPVHTSKDLQHTSEEQSFLLPYQRPPPSAALAITAMDTSSSVSPPEGLFTRPSNLSPVTDECDTDIERKCAKGKRKRRSEEVEDAGEEDDEEAQVSRSPPSWLFDSQEGSGAQEGSGTPQDGPQTEGPAALRETPTVHSDGKQFSYSYQISGRNLQDLSKFRVLDSWLQWAVKYLVTPKQTDVNLHNVLVNSKQSDGAEFISL